MKLIRIIAQQVGDRGKGYYSFKRDISFCIPANPMSDRGQLVIEIYAEDKDTSGNQARVH